jgi:hypothetical protein
MFLRNAAGRDSVWEAEQRGNEELVGWMLAFGEERPEGEVKEVEGEEEEEEEVTMRMGVGGMTSSVNARGDGAKETGNS